MVNWLAVLVVSIVSMAIYMAWYGPLFGKLWMKEMKFKKKDMKMGKWDGPKALLILLIFNGVLSYIVSASTFLGGMLAGFLVWILLSAKLHDAVLWEKKSKTLYLLNVGAHLIVIVLSAGVLAIW